MWLHILSRAHAVSDSTTPQYSKRIGNENREHETRIYPLLPVRTEYIPCDNLSPTVTHKLAPMTIERVCLALVRMVVLRMVMMLIMVMMMMMTTILRNMMTNMMGMMAMKGEM